MAEPKDTERISPRQEDTFCVVAGLDTSRIIPVMEWYVVAKRRMRELGLTQEDFIRPLGVETRGAVGHYFTGRRTPTPVQFKTIASMLKLTMDELIIGADGGVADSAVPPYRPVEQKRPDIVLIDRLSVGASMGPGTYPPDHIEVVESIRVYLPELRQKAMFTAPQNLRIITGYGDSMQPTFADGDPLIVDIGVNEINVDAVYVLELNDQLYIKRVQRRPDGAILMISDNKNYEPYVIKTGEHENLFVRGRVILAWNGKRL